jgi:hypothetical protein
VPGQAGQMNRHVVIAFAVFGVMIAERIWKTARRRRRLKRAMGDAIPDRPLEERLSASGRFKAVVYENADGVFRVELFHLVAGDPTEPYWSRTGGSSFADRAALPSVVDEALRAASGEPS